LESYYSSWPIYFCYYSAAFFSSILNVSATSRIVDNYLRLSCANWYSWYWYIPSRFVNIGYLNSMRL